MTRQSLTPADALLIGRLYLHARGGGRYRPFLGIRVWCPYCHDTHQHSWIDPPFKSNTVDHRAAHCHDHVTRKGMKLQSPLREGGGYFIGLDPSAKAENAKVIREFAEAFTRWEEREAMQARRLVTAANN